MNRTRQFHPSLLSALNAMGDVPFSHLQLLAAFRAKKEEHGKSDKASRQFVDRNLIRLLSEGLIEAIERSDGQKRLYQLTGRTPATRSHQAPLIPQSKRNKDAELIRAKLREQKRALMIATGEIEVLDELCAEQPHMHEMVQEAYNEARDRASKLFGRVKALENLISQPTVAA